LSEFTYSSPQSALEALLARIAPNATESVALVDAAGRVLAESIVADRDSPPCDVSAMDGFAVRAEDCGKEPLPIVGAPRIGVAPPPLAPRAALRIVTGAALPPGADAVVRHEDAHVEGDTMRAWIAIRPGTSIRRRGENLRAGSPVIPAGTIINPAVAGALATFGIARPLVHRSVRIAVMTSGDEIVSVESSPHEWHIRNSNGPALKAMFDGLPFVSPADARHVEDDEQSLREAVRESLERSDALVLTGGVSMGERDFIPSVLHSLGVEVLFHRLPQRPGKPILAGIAPRGQPVLALPGNPVSVLVTARRFVVPTLRRVAGVPTPEHVSAVTLEEADDAPIPLWWHRPVRLIGVGRGSLVAGRGSGDIASAARSDGFVEIPPNSSGAGPWPFLPWTA